MIKFRQKEFSLGLTRGIAKINKIIGKSGNEANRSALKIERKLLNPLVKGKTIAGNISDTINKTVLNPGKVVNDSIIKPSIETPLTAVALKTVPVPGSSVLINKVNKPEKYLWKKLKMDKKLKKVSDKYSDSELGKHIEGGITGIGKGINNMFS